ncbi:MAG: SDR family NAD(P)-dependent oxidoreductase [Myxococcota bacterium]
MARHDLKGRHVVVTGASSGIGAALAVELGRRGAKVGLLARRADKLDEVRAEVAATGAEVAVAAADVSDWAATEAAFAELTAALGPVYGAVANAGIGAPTKGGRVVAERDAQVIAINVIGVIHTFAAAQPAMLAAGDGFLCAVSSVAAWRGLPGFAAYSASKAAVSTFTESLSLKRSGLSVITVHPAFVRTPLTAANRKMPFLVEADAAARTIADGLERGKRQVNFPWQMVLGMRLAQALPDWLYHLLASRG